jgi:hypothetical protein
MNFSPGYLKWLHVSFLPVGALLPAVARFSVAICDVTTSQNVGILTEVECFVTDFF